MLPFGQVLLTCCIAVAMAGSAGAQPQYVPPPRPVELSGSAVRNAGVITFGPESVSKAKASGAVPAIPAQPGIPGRAPVRPAFDPMASESMRSDAELYDVCFIDVKEGWAVGDRGTIWHTSDGGRRWDLQESHVGCALYSVCFVNAQIGWAAGGFTQPFLHTGSGVILATNDGGRHWQPNAKSLIPTVKQIRFYNERLGWVITCPSALFPSGVFFTDSAGQGWEPVPGPGRAWLGAAFLDPSAGVVVGQSGAVARLRGPTLQTSALSPVGLRSLTRVKLVPPQYGWVIGDGGLVLMTGDLGQTWQPTPGPVVPDRAGQFDFAALCVRGPKCWIAGSPGTTVFFSPDAGHTWSVFPTGQPLPLRALTMIDDQQGWAVGALGTILTTADGGRTWRRQRAGGARAGLLGLFADAHDVPLELLARLSGNDGYLSVVEALTRADADEAPADVALQDRLHQAVVAVGGSSARSAWQFPVRHSALGFSAAQTLASWDALHGGQGLRELQAYLVKEIRTWRPDVVVTEPPEEGVGTPAAQLVGRAVVDALQAAGDARAFPEQQDLLGLKPWQVKRAFAMLPSGVRGSCEVSASQMATRLGRSLGEQAAMSHSLLSSTFDTRPLLAFRVLASQMEQNSERVDFFADTNLAPGGEARRMLQDPALDSLETVTRLAQNRRNVQAILEHTAQDREASLGLLAKANQLIRGLDADSGAWLLYQLGHRYHEAGEWEMAAEAFGMLNDRYPEHSLSRPAGLWLLQYYASSAVAWRVQSQQRILMQPASTMSVHRTPGAARIDRAVRIGDFLEQTQPALFAEPALQFSLAAAVRRLGDPRQADRFYQAAVRRPECDAWWAAGEAEHALAEGRGTGPKPALHCVAAAARPRLDGRLDDPVWQRAQSATLASPDRNDAQWPAEVKLAYDREFLYVAITCRQAPGVNYASSSGPRTRDADLTAHDRVELLLDLDRDFATYYRLAVDHRGWTFDSCWDDHTWDPTWFVAAANADGSWTAEAAIPFDQLTAQPPGPGTAWALGVQRIVPGVGFQSWNAPAAPRVIPQGFGYLIFD